MSDNVLALVLFLSLVGLHGMIFTGFMLCVQRDARIRRVRAARARRNLATLKANARIVRKTFIRINRLGA